MTLPKIHARKHKIAGIDYGYIDIYLGRWNETKVNKVKEVLTKGMKDFEEGEPVP